MRAFALAVVVIVVFVLLVSVTAMLLYRHYGGAHG